MATSVDLDHRDLPQRGRTPRAATAARLTPAPRRTRLVVAAATIGTTALVVAAVVGKAAEAPVFADPGMVSRWGLLVSRAVFDLAGMATIGVLVVAVVLLPAASGELSTQSQRLVRIAGRWSA